MHCITFVNGNSSFKLVSRLTPATVMNALPPQQILLFKEDSNQPGLERYENKTSHLGFATASGGGGSEGTFSPNIKTIKRKKKTNAPSPSYDLFLQDRRISLGGFYAFMK